MTLQFDIMDIYAVVVVSVVALVVIALVKRLRVQSLLALAALVALLVAAPTVDSWSGSYTMLGPKEQGVLLLFVALLGLLFIAKAVVAPVIIRRRRTGKLTIRSAAWVYAGLLDVPYVLFLALLAVTSPEALAWAPLLMALTLPVFIISGVAIYQSSEPAPGPSSSA